MPILPLKYFLQDFGEWRKKEEKSVSVMSAEIRLIESSQSKKYSVRKYQALIGCQITKKIFLVISQD